MAELTKLEPRELHEAWDKILPHLKLMKERWPRLATWRPEDLYAMIKYNDAALFCNEDGFAICTIDVDEFTRERALCVFVAASFEPEGSGMIQKYWREFLKLAKEMECPGGVIAISNHPALEKAPQFEREYSAYRIRDGQSTEEAGTDC